MKKYMMTIGLLLSFSTAVPATLCSIDSDYLVTLAKDKKLQNGQSLPIPFGGVNTEWTVKFDGFTVEEGETSTSIHLLRDQKVGQLHTCFYEAHYADGTRGKFELRTKEK